MINASQAFIMIHTFTLTNIYYKPISHTRKPFSFNHEQMYITVFVICLLSYSTQFEVNVNIWPVIKILRVIDTWLVKHHEIKPSYCFKHEVLLYIVSNSIHVYYEKRILIRHIICYVYILFYLLSLICYFCLNMKLKLRLMGAFIIQTP